MTTDDIKIADSAAAAMDSLREADRRSLMELLKQLQKADPAAWPRDCATPLPDLDSLYLLRFTPVYRAIVRYSPPNEFTIRNLVRQETLDFFREITRNGVGTA